MEVEQGQETDLDLLDLPPLINRNDVEDESDDEDSLYAPSNESSLSSAQQMSDGDDGSSMLVEDDISSAGSANDLDYERHKIVVEMYTHTKLWNTQWEYIN